jgi:hypothetical protein
MEQGIVNVRGSESTCRELDEMLESIRTAAAVATANQNINGGGGASSSSSDSAPAASHCVVGRQVDDIRNRFISPVILVRNFIAFFNFFLSINSIQINFDCNSISSSGWMGIKERGAPRLSWTPNTIR